MFAPCRAEANLRLCPAIGAEARQSSLQRTAVPNATWLGVKEAFSHPIYRATAALTRLRKFAKSLRMQITGEKPARKSCSRSRATAKDMQDLSATRTIFRYSCRL